MTNPISNMTIQDSQKLVKIEKLCQFLFEEAVFEEKEVEVVREVAEAVRKGIGG